MIFSVKNTTPPPENFKLSTIKKLATFIILISLIFSCISLSACSEQEPIEQYDEIALTKDNYSDYLAVNIYYTDCTALPSAKTTDRSTYYHLYCVGNIETSRKQGCHFSDVEIEYSVSSILWSTYLSSNPTVNIGYDGQSHCSFSMEITNDSTHIFFPDSSPNFVNISSISGKVYVLKDGKN